MSRQFDTRNSRDGGGGPLAARAGACYHRCTASKRPEAAPDALLALPGIPRRPADSSPLSKDPLMTTPHYGSGIEITGRITDPFAQILTTDAAAFAARLQRAFGG